MALSFTGKERVPLALCLRRKIYTHLPARLNLHKNGLPILNIFSAAFQVDGEFGIHEVPPVCQKPSDSIRVATLLIFSQRKNQVATWNKILPLPPGKICDELGDFVFYV